MIENGEHEVNIFSKTNNLINNTYSAKSVTFYRRFKSFVEKLDNQDKSLVGRMYGVYRANTAALTKYGAYEQQDVENLAMVALHTAVMGIKTKLIRNLPGFFNGVLNKMLDRFVFEEQARVLAKINAECTLLYL
ncbi:hypothetical protein [Domibacillus iocasae]|uniref:Uncharacterized protein n=1 Tax=Domibacillus iocasae TaxID=1714016 RepID=A0A1E7DM99_9BACI|nr:hypothetical protein [Domibacillus iocasae]OES44202.1 hypothetical protein BA724_07880 [Domibacillus iocasae]